MTIYWTNASGWYFEDGRFIPKLAPQYSGDPLLDSVLLILPSLVLLFCFAFTFVMLLSKP